MPGAQVTAIWQALQRKIAFECDYQSVAKPLVSLILNACLNPSWLKHPCSGPLLAQYEPPRAEPLIAIGQDLVPFMVLPSARHGVVHPKTFRVIPLILKPSRNPFPKR